MKKALETFKRIWDLYEPFHKAIGVLIFLFIGIQAFTLLTPYFTGQLVDQLTQRLPEKELYFTAFYIFLAKATEIGMSFLMTYVMLKHMEFEVDGYMTKQTLQKVFGFSIGQVINENSGFRQSVISKGQRAVEDIVQTSFSEIIPTLARILVTIVALAFLSPFICIVVMVGCALYITVSFLVNFSLRKSVKEHRKQHNRLDKMSSELMKNMRLVQINAQEQRILNDFEEVHKGYRDHAFSVWWDYNLQTSYKREPIAAITLFLTIASCIYAVYHQGKSVGNAVVAISWSMMLWANLTKIGPWQRRLTYWNMLASRFFDMLDTPPAVLVHKNPVRPEHYSGKIEFRNVSFTYPAYAKLDEECEETDGSEGFAAVHNISFTVNEGETVALVGHSGAGKSTLVTLLLRGYDPDEGEILIGGYDLRLLDPTHFRKKIGYVEQDVRLWDETLRYNMLFGLNGEAKHVTDAQLEEIAVKSGINHFYSRLGDKKFNALLGENGIKFSGGEKQRVGIARALAKNPPILIFDEATNSLDTKNEYYIQNTIRKTLAGRTGIIIAHRLSTIRHADKIIVLHKGRIVGINSHRRLVDECSYYKELVEFEREALTC